MSSIASCSNRSATGRSPALSVLPIGASYSSELPIAFSKIDGLEVTPLTPSLSISFFKSPLATKPRARKSSQTAWPWFSSALTGFMMPVFCSRRLIVWVRYSAGRLSLVNTRPCEGSWKGADGRNICPHQDNTIDSRSTPAESAVWRLIARICHGAVANSKSLPLRPEIKISLRLQLSQSHHAALFGADKTRQQILQGDILRYHRVVAGVEFDSGLCKHADAVGDIPIGRFSMECPQSGAVHHEREGDVVRAADAIGVILHIAEDEVNLVDIGQVIDDLELARRIGFGCRFRARGGEGEAERRERAPQNVTPIHGVPPSVDAQSSAV